MPKIWIKSNKYSIVVFSLTLLLLLLLGFFYENKVFALHFVDEEDNFALGKFLLSGNKLYSDLFSHHQPLGYILSSLIQKLTQPNSIYLLIKRHREFMIVYSSVWLLYLVLRFRLPFLLFSLIFEPIKYLLLGNLFLSESLSVYPLIYICLTVITKLEKMATVDFVLLGFSTSLVMFLLAPLWPVVIMLTLIFLVKFKERLKQFLSFWIIGFLPLLIISLFFVSLQNYFYNVFVINFLYYIPDSAQVTKETSPLYAIFAPILAFTGPFNDGPSLWLIRSLLVLLIFNCLILLKKKSYTLVGIIFLSLTLINIRFVRAGSEFYNGFHLLPWFAVLTIFAVFTSKLVLERSSKTIKAISVFLVCLTIIASSIVSFAYLLKRDDTNHDLYVNYSQFFDYGEAVRIMKNPGETLFVAPDGWLIYWQADIQPASPMINYYVWMHQVPRLTGYVTDMFENHQPTFFYCDCSINDSEFGKFLTGYQPLKKYGQNTNLYVIKGKMAGLNQNQKQRLGFLNYEIEN